jgi:NAD(P)-dependent dehydrogenase (short-subunit alcohol dehydrogenase family)
MTDRSVSKLFDLTGKVIVVTGGSRGLGKEMVLAYAEAGADVVIASRNYDTCVEAAKEVEDTTGRRALPYGVHVGRWDELPGLVDASYETFGKVDVLVNNAGMSPLYDSLTGVTEKLFDVVISLNLKGPFRLCALFGERMLADGGGSIINVSSTGSIRSSPTIIPYAAAKAGLNTLASGFGLALGPTVRVNTLMAGPFLTDIADAWDMEETQKSLNNHALQRAGQPEEIIGAALYFASDASSYTSGATLRVDGGIP